jgi:hypothetical protein
MNAKTADKIDLVPFRSEIENLYRRHRALKAVMISEKYSDSQLAHQEELLERDVRDVRVKQSQIFGELLLKIIRDVKG